jgi:16S rRNA (uracil1498-N3)-methyltransferase
MSRLPRFFISPDQIHGRHITVSGEDVRHIAMVLRMKPGEILVLCDGKGMEYTATIEKVGRAEIVAGIVNEKKREISSPHVTLGQGLPKFDKMDWIVQKATELGVSSIVPLITERTIVKIKDEEKRIVRWQKICREAAMQSDRIDIPTVCHIQSFQDYLSPLAPVSDTLLLLPWEEGTQPIREVFKSHLGVQNIVVLIGPEGGFSATEAELATTNGFYPVSLGPNILRTETAAIATLSMVLYETSTDYQIANPT